MLKVGVSPAAIAVFTLRAGAEMHCAVEGFVRQRARLTGRPAPPVSAEAVIVAPAPTFTVATAKAPRFETLETFTIPS